MEQQTRVEKYKKLREEIAAMDDANRVSTPYQFPDYKEKGNNQSPNGENLKDGKMKPSTRSISLDDIFKAHEEYTSIVSQDEVEKRQKEIERQRKIDLRNRIIMIAVFVVTFILFICLLVYFINS